MCADKTRLAEWRQLPFYDPDPVLRGLAVIEANPQLQEMPYGVSSLRTRELRPFQERRLGALFFFLMGQVENTQVIFAHTENADYDFVGHFERDGYHHYVPVQMKELVPDFLNPDATLQLLIDGLKKKYVDSRDLTVAINVNRVGTIVPSELDLEGLSLMGFWLFGTTTPDQSELLIIGNLMSEYSASGVYRYPGR